MRQSTKIKIGISVGDPNGIGIEIILKTFQDKRIYDFFTPIVFAHPQNFFDERKNLGLSTPLFSLKNLKKPSKGQLNLVQSWDSPFPISYGKEHPNAGAHAVSSLKAATKALKEGMIDVLVTGPIHKKSIQSKDFRFPGHTDYLNQELEGESLMFMVTDSLKVALVSDHIPLGEITTFLTSARIQKKNRAVSKQFKIRFWNRTTQNCCFGNQPPYRRQRCDWGRRRHLTAPIDKRTI